MTTITIDDPPVEKAISQAAAAAGLPVDEFVRHVLADTVTAQPPSPEMVAKLLAEIAESGKNAPPIPLEDLSRERIYE